MRIDPCYLAKLDKTVIRQLFLQDKETLFDILHRLMDTLGGIVSQIPFVRFVIPELSGYNELMRILKNLWRFLDEEIMIHERELSNDQPRDLIDAFLLEIRRNNENEDTIFDRKLTQCEIYLN